MKRNVCISNVAYTYTWTNKICHIREIEILTKEFFLFIFVRIHTKRRKERRKGNVLFDFFAIQLWMTVFLLSLVTIHFILSFSHFSSKKSVQQPNKAMCMNLVHGVMIFLVWKFWPKADLNKWTAYYFQSTFVRPKGPTCNATLCIGTSQIFQWNFQEDS